MTRNEHIVELVCYLRGFSITMCPASKEYWKEHWEEILAMLRYEEE